MANSIWFSSLKGQDTLGRFSTSHYKGDNFCDFMFAYQVHCEKWFTLKGTNLLPRLLLRRGAKTISTELPP